MKDLKKPLRVANRPWLSSLFLLCGIAALAAASLSLTGCRPPHSGSYGFDNGAEQRDANGTVHISKMGGDIEVQDAPNGADLNTMGGSIRLNNSGSFANVKTMGGNIDVHNVSGPLDATTMGGNIRVLAAADSVHAKSMGGNVSVRLVSPETRARTIDITTMGGPVELVVPKGFPMDIDIEVAYTQSSGHKPVITEPFGLAHSESNDRDFGFGPARKHLYAKGRVGTGDNRVTIHGIGGDVTITQE